MPAHRLYVSLQPHESLDHRVFYLSTFFGRRHVIEKAATKAGVQTTMPSLFTMPVSCEWNELPDWLRSASFQANPR
jgi:hypothetical protein